MGRDVETVVTGMRLVLDRHLFSLEPYIPPLRFNEEVRVVYKSPTPKLEGYK